MKVKKILFWPLPDYVSFPKTILQSNEKPDSILFYLSL